MTIQAWVEILFGKRSPPLNFPLPLDWECAKDCVSIRSEWVDERPAFVWRESSEQWERVYFFGVEQSVALFTREPPEEVQRAVPFTHAVLFESVPFEEVGEVGDQEVFLTLLSLLTTFHTVGPERRGWIFFWPETIFRPA